MEYILINKDTKIRVDTFDWQVSPNGLKFRNIGLSRNGKMPYKSHWIYHFVYEDGRYFDVEIDYNDKFLQLIKL